MHHYGGGLFGFHWGDANSENKRQDIGFFDKETQFFFKKPRKKGITRQLFKVPIITISSMIKN